VTYQLGKSCGRGWIADHLTGIWRTFFQNFSFLEMQLPQERRVFLSYSAFLMLVASYELNSYLLPLRLSFNKASFLEFLVQRGFLRGTFGDEWSRCFTGHVLFCCPTNSIRALNRTQSTDMAWILDEGCDMRRQMLWVKCSNMFILSNVLFSFIIVYILLLLRLSVFVIMPSALPVAQPRALKENCW